MVSVSCTVKDPEGLHAEPVARIVVALRRSQSTSTLFCRGRSADATSLMALMELDARCGDTVEATIEGPDEQEAAAVLEAIIGG